MLRGLPKIQQRNNHFKHKMDSIPDMLKQIG